MCSNTMEPAEASHQNVRFVTFHSMGQWYAQVRVLLSSWLFLGEKSEAFRRIICWHSATCYRWPSTCTYNSLVSYINNRDVWVPHESKKIHHIKRINVCGVGLPWAASNGPDYWLRMSTVVSYRDWTKKSTKSPDWLIAKAWCWCTPLW